MRTDHGLWPGRGIGKAGQPDVKAVACMRDCATETRVASFVPEHARDQHGNLADQNRLVGAMRGAVTVEGAQGAKAPVPEGPGTQAFALLQQYGCVACHSIEQRIVGPSLREVAARHSARSDVVNYLSGRIRNGGQGTWGNVPMPPQTLPDADLRTIAQWLAGGARMP
jgi:cytochrome c